MRVHFCGVRGSTSAPGEAFVRYGGHTSCVALAHDGELPTLVLDAGTGLRLLTPLLEGRAFQGTLLLGHLHWDHTHGLPFFAGGDRDDSRVDLLMPAQGDALAVLSRAMSPPHFPIPPDSMHGHWTFGGIEPGEHRLEGFSVLAREIPHKGGRTFGYRITDGTGTIAYLSDHSPITLGPGPEGLGEYHEAACTLARDVDLLVHDAQYTVAELPARASYGHSAADYAVRLAELAGAAEVMLFHHDPSRTDDAVDAILAGFADAPVPVRAAAEGIVVDLSPRQRAAS